MPETNGHATGSESFLSRLAIQQVFQQAFHALQSLVTNAPSRLGLGYNLGTTHAGDRQIEQVLGYKTTLRYQDYKQAYERYDIAARLVDTYAEETWGHPPTVREDDQADNNTPFEQAWKDLADRLNIYGALELADIQANLGHYAIVLVGLRGQPNLELPAARITSPDDVLYLQNYSEEFLRIERFVEAPDDPAFGRPLLYTVYPGGGADSQANELMLPQATRRKQLRVHASRVVHLRGAHRLDDDVFGIPVLKQVYNQLVNLLKVVGGSGEMYWRDAKRRVVIHTDEGYQTTPEMEDAISERVEDFQHGLRDFLALAGMKASALNGVVASPKDHFDVIMQLIAGTSLLPLRSLLGTEEGRLAGDQDQEQLAARVVRRQVKYAERYALRPLIDLLGGLGAYQLPATPYTVDWGKLRDMPQQQRAAVAKDYATATSQYEAARVTALSNGLSPTVTQAEFRSVWVGLPDEPEVGEVEVPLPVEPLVDTGGVDEPVVPAPEAA